MMKLIRYNRFLSKMVQIEFGVHSIVKSNCASTFVLSANPYKLTAVDSGIFIPIRNKNKQSKNEQDESETDNSDNFDDGINDKNNKVMNINTSSMRLDALLKSGLGIARNKIEVMFYESKIRVNGEKILKKSSTCHIGDEIDIIKGTSPANPKFLIVARVELLCAAAKDDYISLKIRRNKSLTIENYDNPWKGGGSST